MRKDSAEHALRQYFLADTYNGKPAVRKGLSCGERVKQESGKRMMILIAGPYRSGTDDDPVLIKRNVEAMEACALPIFSGRAYSDARRVAGTAARGLGRVEKN